MSRYEELRKQIDGLLAEIKLIQESCGHEKHELTPHSYRDYGSSSTDYWYDIKCVECGKFWSENQAEYRKRYGRING